MRLTKAEKEICKEYSQKGEDGRCRCAECPLALDRRFCICKRNITKKEWEQKYYPSTCLDEVSEDV